MFKQNYLQTEFAKDFKRSMMIQKLYSKRLLRNNNVCKYQIYQSFKYSLMKGYNNLLFQLIIQFKFDVIKRKFNHDTLRLLNHVKMHLPLFIA